VILLIHGVVVAKARPAWVVLALKAKSVVGQAAAHCSLPTVVTRQALSAAWDAFEEGAAWILVAEKAMEAHAVLTHRGQAAGARVQRRH
jgi:hypothetical protein